MGLISKTVKIKWNSKNKKYYEKLGYIFTNYGEEFEIRVEDLQKGSHVKVNCICDNCGCDLSWQYQDYNKSIKKDGKTYCQKCVKILYSGKKQRDTKIKKSKSFAQWLIDNFGENALELYWDYDGNTVDPWRISYKTSRIKIWIKCQEKDYHGSYEVAPINFVVNKSRCPFCNKNSGKVHPLDSLKQFIINKFGKEFFSKIWNNKNTVDPSTISSNSAKMCWWNCPDGKHEPFKRSCNQSYHLDFRCPECVKERKESIIEEKTKIYLEELGYEVKTEHNCTIRPINPKTKNLLPFDNEIILENGEHLIIEVHGEQHYRVDGLYTKTQEDLNKRKLYDRYKRIKCIQAGYEYLEIPYTAFDKKETYKKLIDNKIKEILLK